MKKCVYIVLAVMLTALVFTACEGPAGPTGTAGSEGPPGQDGDGVVPGNVTISGSPIVAIGPVTAAYDNPGNSPQLYYRWYAGGDYSTSIGTSATYTPVAANVGKTLTCRVYAVGFAGYKESAATVAVAPLAWPSTIALGASGVPTNGSFSAQSDVFWYSFTAPSATSVTILVDDAYYTSGSQTAYVSVSAYKADGTPFFVNYERLYPATTDSRFSGYTGLVYIKVTWTDRGDAYVPNGTFTVDYSVTP